jgi:glutathione S-transferase
LPAATLYALPASHPCAAVELALRLKGVDFRRVDMIPVVSKVQQYARFRGFTVPAIEFDDGEKVLGSREIVRALEHRAPDPPLLPADGRARREVEEAERWGDEELQDLGRRLPWGALHFRPESLGTFGGAGTLDPAGTDFAIRMGRASWKYHGITAQRLADDLAGLPAKLDRVDALAREGTIGGERANAADLQIGATLRVLLTVGDLRPLLEGRAGEAVARRWFADYPGDIPAGAFPAGWVPSR